MSTLALQRCFQHPEREAVARCLECSQFYCRECITEHGGRLICASCLARLSAPVVRTPRTWPRVAGSVASAAAGVLAGWYSFHALGRMLIDLPAAMENSALWNQWIK